MLRACNEQQAELRGVFRMPIQTEITRASGAALSMSVCHGWLVPVRGE